MLSNKLTFSLSFIVMLVCGLAIMATPVMAQKYSADWTDANDWDITIFIPHTEFDGDTGVAPAEPIEYTASDGFTGLTLVDTKGEDLEIETGTFVGPTAVDSEGMITSDRADVVGHTYAFSVIPPADPSGLADGTDDTEIRMTVGDYTTVVIDLSHRTSNIEDAPLTILTLGVNTFEVTITTATSPFAVLAASTDNEPDSVTGVDNNGEAYLDNGIEASLLDEDSVVQDGEGMPDLDSFFRNGGTIKLLDSGENGDDAVVSGEAFITEVMWGVDGGNLTGAPSTDSQWIEVYYQGDAEEVTLHVQFIFGAHDPAGLDAVGNLYLAKWSPLGQSGHSQYGEHNGETAGVPDFDVSEKKSCCRRWSCL